MSADTAPAAMPGERDRIAMICMEIEDGRSADNVAEMFRVYGESEHDCPKHTGKRVPYGCGRCDIERARQYADRILALFAPILAEKEQRVAEWQAEVRREGDRFKGQVNDLNAECDRLHARALAAEAALAKIADALEIALWKLRVEGWDGDPALEQGEEVLEGYRAAAAIRAQGAL